MSECCVHTARFSIPISGGVVCLFRAWGDAELVPYSVLLHNYPLAFLITSLPLSFPFLKHALSVYNTLDSVLSVS